MDDEKKLNSIFEVDKDNFSSNTLIKNARKKSMQRIILTSFIVCICTCILIGFMSTSFTRMIVTKAGINKDLFEDIAYPNTYVKEGKTDYKLFGADVSYVRYKIVGNKPVYTGIEEYSYSLFSSLFPQYGFGFQAAYGAKHSSSQLIRTDSYNSEQEYDSVESYTYLGQRVMKFYHPKIAYTQYENALSKLDKLDSQKEIELSLSFDKLYSIDEIKKIIPKNISLAWYWVDTFTQQDLENMKEDNSSEFDKRHNDILTEFEVYGFNSNTEEGIYFNKPEKRFIDAIERGKELKGEYNSEFSSIFRALKNTNDTITKENLKIIGVVVTGDAESLKKLQTSKFIKASSFGVIIDKY